ncbi:MAG: Arm DNA-binding domain-containing protein [Pseudomonadota bacterium]|nr:Arm DNA-binding domain-containing protein [Pseudomonadota bacterium]
MWPSRNQAYPNAHLQDDSRPRAVEKPQRFFDEQALFLLLLTPSGSRLWRFKYRFPINAPLRKEKLLALRTYLGVSLKECRENLDEARRDLRRGIDTGSNGRVQLRRQLSSVAMELVAMFRKVRVAMFSRIHC